MKETLFELKELTFDELTKLRRKYYSIKEDLKGWNHYLSQMKPNPDQFNAPMFLHPAGNSAFFVTIDGHDQRIIDIVEETLESRKQELKDIEETFQQRNIKL